MNLFVSYQYNAKVGDQTVAGYGNVIIKDCTPIDSPMSIDFIRGSIIKAAMDGMNVDSINPTILFFKELGDD